MRFAFSNIAWSPNDAPGVLALLRAKRIQGIEVAPSKVWPEWQGATPAAAALYRASLLEEGFEVPALQAVLFGRPEARLFDPQGERHLISHLTRVAAIAGALGAGVVVFGAPRQRDRGDLEMESALESASRVFRELGKTYADHGSCLCIEPNPKRYGCSFVVNSVEGEALVRRVNHPGFGLHLDAAAMFLEGEDLAARWPALADIVRHYHISEPDLADFRQPAVPHQMNLAVLRRNGFTGWCSVEMREPSVPLDRSGPWAILEGAR